MNTWTIFFIFLAIAAATNGRQHEIPREFFRSVLPEEVSSRPRGKLPSEGTTPLVVWPPTTTEWLKDSTTTTDSTETTIDYTTEAPTTTTTDDSLITNSTQYPYSIEESETTTLVSSNTTENEYEKDFSSELPPSNTSTIPTPTTTEETTTQATTETTIGSTSETTVETTAETTTEATVEIITETTSEQPASTPDYNYIATSIEQEDYFNTDGILASIEVSTAQSTSPITINKEFTETTTENNVKLRMIPSLDVTSSSMVRLYFIQHIFFFIILQNLS